MRSNHFPGSEVDSPEPPPPPRQPQPAAVPPQISDVKYAATVIREGFGPSIAASLAGGLTKVVGIAGFQEFRADFIKEFGGPRDGGESLLFDQLIWLHFRGGELLAASAKPGNTAEHAAAYAGAGARLLGEYRKSLLALKEYRAPARQAQNVTLSAHAQVAVVGQSGMPQPAAEVFQALAGQPTEPTVAPEIFGAQASKALAHEQFEPLFPKPKANSGRAPEPVEARRTDAGGVASTARSGAAQSPLGGGCGKPS